MLLDRSRAADLPGSSIARSARRRRPHQLRSVSRSSFPCPRSTFRSASRSCSFEKLSSSFDRSRRFCERILTMVKANLLSDVDFML